MAARYTRWVAILPFGIALAAAGSAWRGGVHAAYAADDDSVATAKVIFARGSSLFRIEARGRGEVEIAQLPAKVSVRALRSDAAGKVLLVDLAGKWGWMPLDGTTKSVIDLPCADGPAQLTEDGTRVLCRSVNSPSRSVIVELAAPTRPIVVDVPPGASRLVGSGNERALVWSDSNGVWMAPVGALHNKTRVAPEPPLRGFLASPDGSRAVGVYADHIYTDAKHTRAAEVLMSLQLDTAGARRKAIRDGVALEWSHDSQWVLVQDGGSACIMRAVGGQYKCWRGVTAASLSNDGRWGLVLGNRDGSRKQRQPKSAKTVKKAPPRRGKAARLPDPNDKPWDHIDDPYYEPANEPEGADGSDDDDPDEDDDVSVAPPTGPLSLFRVRLEGAYTDRPILVAKVVDGAAVWISGP